MTLHGPRLLVWASAPRATTGKKRSISNLIRPLFLSNGDPEPLRETSEHIRRKTHDVMVIAGDLLDEEHSPALDRVGTRFVHRLPRRDVIGDLVRTERS